MTTTVSGLDLRVRPGLDRSRSERLLPYLRIGLPLTAAANGLLVAVHPLDANRFAPMGADVLTGHFDAVYAKSWNQGGPLQLVLSWLLMLGAHGPSPSRWLVAAISAALVLVAMSLARTARTELIAGLICLMWLAAQQPWNGHPAELLVSVGWVLALRWQQTGRWLSAASALAAGVAIAPWAVLAFPALLATAGVPRAARTAIVATGLSGLVYLPFALTGHFAMFSQQWMIFPDSAMHLLWPGRTVVGWPLRFGQAVVVLAGTALVALRSRSTSQVLLAAPLAAALLRVITDPQTYDYYWISVAVLVVLWSALSPEPTTPLRWLGLIGLCYLPWAMTASGPRLIGPEWVGALISLALMCWLTRPERSSAAPATGR